MIRAVGIEKSYGNIPVLRGVDIEVQEREIISIVGASGAGKTTLLHILGTLDTADKGQISFAGTEISKLNPKQMSAFRNVNIGFVFQSHYLLPEFTALENVAMPGLIANKSYKKCISRAEELLNQLGLKHRMQHKPAALSGGEQQRVSVARALMNEPKVVFADEPSGNLDSENAKALHRLFFELRDNFGQTFVVVTHNEELANLADRKVTMKDGKIF